LISLVPDRPGIIQSEKKLKNENYNDSKIECWRNVWKSQYWGVEQFS